MSCIAAAILGSVWTSAVVHARYPRVCASARMPEIDKLVIRLDGYDGYIAVRFFWEEVSAGEGASLRRGFTEAGG